MMDEKVTINVRGLGLIGLLGGLGGAINASLLYVQAMNSSDKSSFSWQIIPAGVWHGSALALASVGFATLLSQRGRLIRWAGLLITGWISGWLSCFSIRLYMERIDPGPMWESRPPLMTDLLEVLVWPFSEGMVAALWNPYASFGLVGAALYLCLTMRDRFPQGLPGYLLMGSLSGSLGSLWWWIAWGGWHHSLIHGIIWGSLVGFGVWKSQQRVRMTT